VSLAAIGSVGTLDRRVYYYPTVSAAPKTLQRHYFVGNAQLADNGKRTVLTTSQYGSISDKVAVASKKSSGKSWTGFKAVKGSYTLGDSERVVTAGRKIRMVGVSGKSIYHPFTWTWKRRAFKGPRSTGDHHDISSIDATSDGSGRLVTACEEVNGIMVSNFGHGSRAGRFLFKVKQTYAGGPAQISTTSRGRGFLIWGVEKLGVTGQILKAQAIKLPPPPRRHHHRGGHDRALVADVTTRERS
jgi:hypothetical protein